MNNKTAVDADDEKKVVMPTVKLIHLLDIVLDMKQKALYSCNGTDRDKLYKKLNYLESILLELTNVNVELERDWWK